MADLSIQKDFIEGTHEIFSTMFNDGKTTGINLYLMSEKTKANVYGESKYKMYKAPKLLVAQTRLTPTQGEQDVEVIKDISPILITTLY